MLAAQSSSIEPGTTRTVLVTGATGYLASRLIPFLERRDDLTVRCLARRHNSAGAASTGRTQWLQGDLLDGMSLYHALEGADVAYYLVHSADKRDDFESQDRIAAQMFAQAAQRLGVRRIIYVGLLGDEERALSPHVRSRQEVGRLLRDVDVDCVEFRAAAVWGRGSQTFEFVQTLVRRQPLLLCPRWFFTPIQPVATDDMLAYLLAALDLPPGGGRVFEVGGADVVTCRDLLRCYAQQCGLRRLILPWPGRAPRLSRAWLSLVVPAHARLARLWSENLRHPAVVRDPSALGAFPIRPVGIAAATRRALARGMQGAEQSAIV